MSPVQRKQNQGISTFLLHVKQGLLWRLNFTTPSKLFAQTERDVNRVIDLHPPSFFHLQSLRLEQLAKDKENIHASIWSCCAKMQEEALV